MEKEVEYILNKIKDGSLNIRKLSKETGIPSSRMYKWKDRDSRITAEDATILKYYLEKVDNVPYETESLEMKDEQMPYITRRENNNDPMTIIAELVQQTKVLTRNNERLTITNETLVNTALANLSEILKVSGLSSEVKIDRRMAVQQGASLDKSKTHSGGKRDKRKDIVSETGK